ncbi:MAG: type I 3-dehydroquinate dehydratase [Halobacteria archaeon]|nr:type I 3-dehydroquinate dehydratase [Halobacteria archaeon]
MLGTEPAVVAPVTSDLERGVKRADDKGADAVELRMDLYAEGGEKGAEDALADLREVEGSLPLPVVVTNRPPNQGGDFDGDEQERFDLLIEAVDHADAADVELTASEEHRQRAIERANQQDVTVVVSYHDFDGTPPNPEMRRKLESSFSEGDLAKLAVTPRDRGDVLRLLETTLGCHEDGIELCTISMGSLGSHTRVVAPFYGSRLTYATLDDSTAPGQMSVEEVIRSLESLGIRS